MGGDQEGTCPCSATSRCHHGVTWGGITPLLMQPLPCSALNSSDIKVLGVDLLPGYYDPFSGRTLTKGEVGCFLSHYNIWKEVRGHGGGPKSHPHGAGTPRASPGPCRTEGDAGRMDPAWCWGGFAPLPPPHRSHPGAWSARWCSRTTSASRPPSRHGCGASWRSWMGHSRTGTSCG